FNQSLDPWGSGAGVGAGIAAQARISLARADSRESCAFLLEQASSSGLAGWIEQALKTSPTRAELEFLLQRSAAGIGVLEAPSVVIAGVPNAGKSTLFNLLVGESRVLTWHQPGTTRDLIEAQAVFSGFPISLIDGAGIRQVEEAVEREGVRRMQLAIDGADLVLHLIPSSAGGREYPALETPSGRTLVFRSRCDENSECLVEGPGISALTGEGIDSLKNRVLQELYGVEQIPRGAPCLFLPSHRHWIEQALVAIDGGTDPHSKLLNLAEPR
ncbi:MAG: 50S ribosome-binding GTPase, partial [Planctomycetota bacterium]|nr:50S ribosome-binding GTPase [Planctomycetota bacterium]